MNKTKLVIIWIFQDRASEVLLDINEIKTAVDIMEVNDNIFGDSDEVKSLLENIGEDPTDPNGVAFLLPLRGHVGNLGMLLVIVVFCSKKVCVALKCWVLQ